MEKKILVAISYAGDTCDSVGIVKNVSEDELKELKRQSTKRQMNKNDVICDLSDKINKLNKEIEKLKQEISVLKGEC